MELSYLVRYGAMSTIGRFSAEPGQCYAHGAPVVVRSHRGLELGEVLIPAPESSSTGAPDGEGLARILREALPEDLARVREAECRRSRLLDDCLHVFEGEGWPIELLDVEPLLDENRLVLHYLGPHKLDVAGLLAIFRERYRYDVMFQPVGRDVADDAGVHEHELEHEHGCGSRGDGGGCGAEGGCGDGGGCGTGTASACDGCGVKQLLQGRR